MILPHFIALKNEARLSEAAYFASLMWPHYILINSEAKHTRMTP
jgi:hypothetical protein